jgi:DNA repair ATPase RecN
MERNYDELIAEIIIRVSEIGDEIKTLKGRTDFNVKRITKLENQVESLTKKLDSFRVSYDEQIAFQSRLNSSFLDYMNRNPK